MLLLRGSCKSWLLEDLEVTNAAALSKAVYRARVGKGTARLQRKAPSFLLVSCKPGGTLQEFTL